MRQGLGSHLRVLEGRWDAVLGCDFPLAATLLGGALSLWLSQLWRLREWPGWRGLPATRLPAAGGRRCGVPSPHSPFPLQGPRHKLLSIGMGRKILLPHLHVELRGHQWVAKSNSCLCFKLERKSLGRCPKSSYFSHLRLKDLFLGTKPPSVNTEPGAGWLQRWTSRFAFPVIRKQQQKKPETSSLNLRAWIKSLHSLKD